MSMQRATPRRRESFGTAHPRSPGPQRYSFLPCFSEVVLGQSAPAFSYPISQANGDHQLVV